MKMITVLQCRQNWRIFRCVNYANRQIFSGFAGTLKCITRRNIYDSEQGSLCPPRDQPPPPPLQQLPNRSKYCKPPAGKRPGVPPGGSKPPGEDKNLRILIGLLALGGAAAAAYYLSNRGSREKGGQESSGKLLLPVKVPPSSDDLPKEVPYLLVGGGTASFSAFRAIKSHDPKAKVLVISNEFERPYMRPPLSKELWYHAEKNIVPADFKFKQWNGAERSLFYEPAEFYIEPTKLMQNENGGVAVAQGYTVKKVDVCERKVILTDGAEITYGECLLATGCVPKNLDVFESAPLNVKERVSVFRTTQDFVKLKEIAESKKSIAIIGSGFLGSELSCALAKHGSENGLQVYQIFFESGNMAKILPEYLSKWTMERVQDQGVCVIPKTQIDEANFQNNQVKLQLSNGKTVMVDHIVVCVGCEPNTAIAEVSGLETDSKLGGFVVNAELEARRHLYVAGDAACFYDPLLGRRRVEHHDHSVVSGRLAGENMTGAKKPYKHQSMFWSDLGPQVGFEGIGVVDSALPTVGVFAKKSASDEARQVANPQPVDFKHDAQDKGKEEEDAPNDEYDKGVIFYLKDGKVVGILLWNIFNRINVARKVINENKKFADLNEVAKLFDIHS